MKKMFILVTALLLVLSMSGCSLMLMQMAAMPVEPTEPTVVTEPTQPEKEWPGFNGTDYKYVYLYEEGCCSAGTRSIEGNKGKSSVFYPGRGA